MVEIRKTAAFAEWFDDLRDVRARARIEIRLRRLELGLPGDIKPVGDGISELRVDYGPGYRVYLVQRGKLLIVVLGGGDKRTQDTDINSAKKLAAQL